MERDRNGYPIMKPKHSPLIHRQIAYSEIYLKNRYKYPKPFSKYLVHHIDTDKDNFSVNNLYICTKEQHDAIHEEQKKNLKKFENSEEIEKFLLDLKKRKHKNLEKFSVKVKKGKQKSVRKKRKKDKKIKKYKCEDCKREIFHRGYCFPCNIKRKEYRESKFKSLERERKRKKKGKRIKRIFKFLLVLAFIMLLLWMVGFSAFDNKEIGNTENQEDIVEQEIIEPQFKLIIVEGSKTDVIIINNKETAISLNVTYKIYSKWFGMDSQESKIFDVNAKEQKSFIVYSNEACNRYPCSVTIISYDEI